MDASPIRRVPTLLRRLHFFLIALAVLGAALPARATFHLWAIDEAFSNADGTVQYIELRALAGGQEFLAGHTIIASGGGGAARSFTFPRSLAGDTSGRRALVATAGFAALGIVTPDYVVPNGFFSQSGGSIEFAEGSDTWNHGALPTDGRNSLARNGSVGAASPTNFSGDTGTVNLAAGTEFNAQGLWWRSPAGSESGWGLGLTHQGTILFGTWFTYDTDGSDLWLVLPETRRAAPNTYTGPIFRTRGPAFSAVPWDPAQVTATQVGTGTITLTDANNGTFAYTVNGTSQTKAITRQVYATPASVCAVPSTP